MQTALQFEYHLVQRHSTTSDGHIPLKYVYAMARELWKGKAFRAEQLDHLQRLMFEEEEEAADKLSLEMANLERLLVEAVEAVEWVSRCRACADRAAMATIRGWRT